MPDDVNCQDNSAEENFSIAGLNLSGSMFGGMVQLGLVSKTPPFGCTFGMRNLKRLFNNYQKSPKSFCDFFVIVWFQI